MPQDVYIYEPGVCVPEYVTHVEIPPGVTKIKTNAFRDCRRLQSVTISDSVTEIGKESFLHCTGLKTIIIPGNVIKIGVGAFTNCENLKEVIIQNGVRIIERNAFDTCRSLETVVIPDSVTEIGDRTFLHCLSLRSVTLPDSLTRIRWSTFYGCPALQSFTVPDTVSKIERTVFCYCTGLRSVTIPDTVTAIEDGAFAGCPALQSLMYKGINIAALINIDGYGVNTFSVIKELTKHQIPLNADTVKLGIDMKHQGKMLQWIREYPVFGEMLLPENKKHTDSSEKEYLRRCFAEQKRTGHHVPKILKELTLTACACGIPPARLVKTFDVKYTETLIHHKTPIIPAEACRCYYDRNICNALIKKGRISVMAEAIRRYNSSRHQACYKHLMDFIVSHMDTKTDILLYAVKHAKEIPMRADTTAAQIRRHREYTGNLAEVKKIERKYRKVIPGFKLSDYPHSQEQTDTVYREMTARILDLSDPKDVTLAAGLGDLTNCCQCLGCAGETAMMHGFLNPDAGFWVIEDGSGTVKAQAEIWKADPDTLVFDNIEFANTDNEHLSGRAEQFRGVIAAWAMKSGYKNIIMGCGYNDLGIGHMEWAPTPELRLTPEEVFALQRENDAGVSFDTVADAGNYMQTGVYDPYDFVYSDTYPKCVYIKKDGIVSDYLMQGYIRPAALPQKGIRQEHVRED